MASKASSIHPREAASSVLRCAEFACLSSRMGPMGMREAIVSAEILERRTPWPACDDTDRQRELHQSFDAWVDSIRQQFSPLPAVANTSAPSEHPAQSDLSAHQLKGT